MPLTGSSSAHWNDFDVTQLHSRQEQLLVFYNRVYILALGLTRNWRCIMAKAKKKAKKKAAKKK